MDKHTKLDVIFSRLVIPMVCTYTSELFKTHKDATVDFFNDFIAECKGLHSEFVGKCIKTDVEVILLLLPVSDKDELNKTLHDKLKAFQS